MVGFLEIAIDTSNTLDRAATLLAEQAAIVRRLTTYPLAREQRELAGKAIANLAANFDIAGFASAVETLKKLEALVERDGNA